jgi:hypothetical protein
VVGVAVRQRQLRNPADERWDFLKGTLPGRINPTDIDLAYERNGNFLFLEGKRPGVLIPKGQQIFFDRLADLPNFTVIRFEGYPPDSVKRFRYWHAPDWTDGDADALRAEILLWFEWKEKLKKRVAA